jgi:hypothetical protein
VLAAAIPAATLTGHSEDECKAALSRLAAGAQEAEALRARVMELEQEVKDLRTASRETVELRAEVERLREKETYLANLTADWQRKLTSAESRLAAIRERGTNRLEIARRRSAARVGVEDIIRWVLEGDAPQEATETHGFYPCGLTCTHDDATTPGHPERVRQRSEAVVVSLHDSKAAAVDTALTRGYDEGVEAMRAACWEAVQECLGLFSVPADAPMRQKFKAAIEGAVP